MSSETETAQREMLKAINLVCRREGILPPKENPTPAGQVFELVRRAMRSEELAERYRQQFIECRQASYEFSEAARQAQAQVDQIVADAADEDEDEDDEDEQTKGDSRILDPVLNRAR